MKLACMLRAWQLLLVAVVDGVAVASLVPLFMLS